MPVRAETAPDQPAAGKDEIIVTANKRSERLIDVAGSISAVRGDDLQRRQALDLQDLAKAIAGLDLQQSGTPGINRIVLRGLNAGGDGATVASVVDNAPLSFSAANTNGAFVASDFDTFDIARVEVLRGPQGTLYGATAEGGLVRYVTNPADPTGWHFGAEAGVNAVAHGEAGGQGKAYVNAPLAPNAAIRVAGFYVGVPGWADDPQRSETNSNHGRRYGVRGNLFWEPVAGLTIRALALYQNGRNNGNGAVQVNGLGNPADPFGLVDGYTYRSYTPDYATSKYQLYSLDIAGDLGFAKLESITSLGQVDVASTNDIPGYANVLAPSTSAQNDNADTLKKVSQELRLSSKPGAKVGGVGVDWQLGFFYTREKVVLEQAIPLLSQPSGAALLALVGSHLPSQFEDVAGYADVTVHFSDSFDIEGGLRVARNTQHSQLTQSGLLVGGVTTVYPEHDSAETATTFQVAPRYHFSHDAMIYARVARGYRPGGPQIPIPGAPAGIPLTFGHDTTMNYEAGLKGEFFERTFTADVAAFYIDWTNVQVLTTYLLNNTQFTITGNVGKAVSKGFEWNFAWKPVKNLTLSAIGAYTDAHLTRDAPVLSAANGDALPYVADLNSTLGFDYQTKLSKSLDGFVGASWTYVGKRYSDFPFHTALPTYSTFDAQVGLRTGRYTFEIYAKNLSDQRGVTNYVPLGAFGGSGYTAIIRPRTVGARLTADF